MPNMRLMQRRRASAPGRLANIPVVPSTVAFATMVGDSIFGGAANYAFLQAETYNSGTTTGVDGVSYGLNTIWYGRSGHNPLHWFDMLTRSRYRWNSRPYTSSPARQGRGANAMIRSNNALGGQQLSTIANTSGDATMKQFMAGNPGGFVIIEGGTNDVFPWIGQGGVDAKVALLKGYIDSLIAKVRGYGARMLIVPILDRTQSNQNTDATSSAIVAQYNAYLASLAQNNADICVPDVSGFVASSATCGDGTTHPNTTGAYIVAKAMADAFNAKFAATAPADPLFTTAADPANLLVTGGADKASFATGGGTLTNGTGTVGAGWTHNNGGLSQAFTVPSVTLGLNKGYDLAVEVEVDAGAIGFAGFQAGVQVPSPSVMFQCFTGLSADSLPVDGGGFKGVVRPYVMVLDGVGSISTATVAVNALNIPVAGGVTIARTLSLVTHPVYGNFQQIQVVASDNSVNFTARIGRPGMRLVDTIPPLLLSGSAPQGTNGQAYSFVPTVAGNVGTPVYSISTGTLPAGLSLNTATGAITGTPTTAGTTAVTLQVKDGSKACWSSGINDVNSALNLSIVIN